MSHWGTVWTIIGTIEPLLIGAYFSVLGWAPPEWRLARGCIVVASGLLGLTGLFWSYDAVEKPEIKIFVNILVVAAVLIGSSTGLKWIGKKKSSFDVRETLQKDLGITPEAKTGKAMFPQVLAITASLGVALIALSSNVETKIEQFGPASNSLDVKKGDKVILQWRVQGFRAKVILNDLPVDLTGSREFIANNNRTFVLRAEGFAGADSREYKVSPIPDQGTQPDNSDPLAQLHKPTPTPTQISTPIPTPRPSPPPRPTPSVTPVNTPSPMPAPPPQVPTVAILDSQVNNISTAHEVSSEATTMMAAFFRMHHYNFSLVPKNIKSLDQYVGMVRSSNPTQAGWVAQVVMEMHPTVQHKNTNSPASMSFTNPNGMVDVTMNCSVTIKLARLPSGSYPSTVTGQSKVVRTMAESAMATTVKDSDFSRDAADRAMIDALSKLQMASAK